MASQFDFVRGMMNVVKMALPFPKPDWQAIAVPAPAFIDALPDAIRDTEGSLVTSHYGDGTVRRENLLSGVIQERLYDGSLTVSLPEGKILRQAFEGAPLLLLDLERETRPALARIVEARIEDQPSLAYHYADPQAGDYLVELSTLRHFEVLNPAFFALG